MPYYIYRLPVGPVPVPAKIAQYDVFREASAEAKRLRQEADPEKFRIKVVFGEDELAAEQALLTVREPEPITGDDW